jgi:RimJ/RimL family protein N-acetyltransferase
MAYPVAVEPREDILRGRIERSGELADGMLMLGVETEGRLVGEVQARQPREGLPPGVFELGIELYEPADRGRGVGRQATALITSMLFERFGAHRVQASTDAENRPMHAVLERLGFVREGRLRAFMPSPNGPRDYLMYAITRDDWEKKKTQWTHPS